MYNLVICHSCCECLNVVVKRFVNLSAQLLNLPRSESIYGINVLMQRCQVKLSCQGEEKELNDQRAAAMRY